MWRDFEAKFYKQLSQTFPNSFWIFCAVRFPTMTYSSLRMPPFLQRFSYDKGFFHAGQCASCSESLACSCSYCDCRQVFPCCYLKNFEGTFWDFSFIAKSFLFCLFARDFAVFGLLESQTEAASTKKGICFRPTGKSLVRKIKDSGPAKVPG